MFGSKKRKPVTNFTLQRGKEEQEQKIKIQQDPEKIKRRKRTENAPKSKIFFIPLQEEDFCNYFVGFLDFFSLLRSACVNKQSYFLFYLALPNTSTKAKTSFQQKKNENWFLQNPLSLCPRKSTSMDWLSVFTRHNSADFWFWLSNKSRFSTYLSLQKRRQDPDLKLPRFLGSLESLSAWVPWGLFSEALLFFEILISYVKMLSLDVSAGWVYVRLVFRNRRSVADDSYFVGGKFIQFSWEKGPLSEVFAITQEKRLSLEGKKTTDRKSPGTAADIKRDKFTFKRKEFSNYRDFFNIGCQILNYNLYCEPFFKIELSDVYLTQSKLEDLLNENHEKQWIYYISSTKTRFLDLVVSDVMLVSSTINFCDIELTFQILNSSDAIQLRNAKEAKRYVPLKTLTSHYTTSQQ